MPQPQLVDGRPTPAYGPQGAVAAAAATSSRPQAQEVGLVGETVAIVSTNQDSRGEGRVGEDVDGSTPGHSSSRSDSTEDVDVDVDVDVDGIEDESSTASGTSVAEDGWDSGHGLDNEEVVGKGGAGGGGGELPAAVRKRNSFRRAFDKARWVLVAGCCCTLERSLCVLCNILRSLLPSKPLLRENIHIVDVTETIACNALECTSRCIRTNRSAFAW